MRRTVSNHRMYDVQFAIDRNAEEEDDENGDGDGGVGGGKADFKRGGEAGLEKGMSEVEDGSGELGRTGATKSSILQAVRSYRLP